MAKKKKEDDEDEKRIKQEEFMELALDRLKLCVDAEKDDRAESIKDLNFMNGKDVWDAREIADRDSDGRPHLQIDLISKNVSQLVGEERQNRPRITVKAISSNATIHNANIRRDLMEQIQYLSHADIIYSQAYEQVLEGAFGAWMIRTRDCEDNPFLREAYLESIPNPHACYIDPTKKREFGFILEKMSRKTFEKRWPKAQSGGDNPSTGQGIQNELYYDKNSVIVAEYYVKKYRKTAMCQMEDGTVLTKTEADKLIKEWDEENEKQIEMAQAKIKLAATPSELPPPESQGPAIVPQAAQQAPQTGMAPQGGAPPQPGKAPPMAGPPGQPQQPPAMPPQPPPPSPEAEGRPKIVEEKDAEIPYIKQYIITASEVLNENGLAGEDFPGRHIPIVKIFGRQRNIEGKTYTRSFIRAAKDPAKLYNYWKTSAAETVALVPKAPIMVTAKMVEGYENEYALAGQKNFAYLIYNIDEDAPAGSKPERLRSADPPVAMFQQSEYAKQDVKETLGMFNRDVGDVGPERTGEAVRQVQKPGDIGTFPFFDNLLRGIAQTGEILNDIIPEIYDTERDIRVKGIDGTESFAPINTKASDVLKRVRSDPERYHGMDVSRIKKHINKHGTDSIFNEIAVGKYETRVIAGPSYATQREESQEKLLRLFTAAPKQMTVALPTIVRDSDIREADKIADMLEKTLPPGIVPPDPTKPPVPPPPISPQMKLLLLKGQTELAKQQNLQLKTKLEMIKLQKELQETGKSMRKEVLDVLAEVHAPEHPADYMGGMGE